MNAQATTEAAATQEPELPLPHPDQPADEAALREAWARVRRQLKRYTFDEAMAKPLLAKCIHNTAHAIRAKKGA